MDIIELELENRKDFLSVDKLTAISSEGEIFNVGDNVKHEGDDEEKIGIISHFTLNEDNLYVVAHTEHGFGSISFLYK